MSKPFCACTCEFAFLGNELSSRPFSFPHTSDYSHLGPRHILGLPEINMICCLKVHRSSERDAESWLRPPLPPYRFLASTCHHWPTPPALLCSWLHTPGLREAVGRTGGRGGQGAWLVLGTDGRKGDISCVIVQPHYSS